MVSTPDSVVKYRLQVFLQSVDGVLTHDFLFYSFTVHRQEAFWKTKIQTSKNCSARWISRPVSW